MRRLLILLAAAAVVVAACGSDRTLRSPTGGDTANGGISVTGQGRVTGIPDTMVITLGVSVLRPTVGQATGDAATLADAVIAALKAGGVAEAAIQTPSYSVYPEYDYREFDERLRGYRVSNQLQVKVRDLDRAGELIDAATAAGGDDTVVHGLSFSIEDNQALLEAARAAAWADAEAKARQLARLAGLTLGRATSITETIQFDVPPVFFEAAEFARTATPIQPGQSDVTVVVQVTFALG